MTVELRTLTPDDVGPAWDVLETVFGYPPHPEDREPEFGVVDPCRFYGGYDGDAIVATAGSFALQMAVPGTTTDVAGVSWISVLPTHRRQGILRSIMRRQLDDLHASGAAVAALWATEGAIYQRYGYGPAAWNTLLSVPSGARFVRPVDAAGVALVEPTGELLTPIYDTVAARTPGWSARDDAWWRFRLHDPQYGWDENGPLRCAVTEGGYALHRARGRFTDEGPDGRVQVVELAAATPDAHARLWRFLLDLDLMRTVDCRNNAPDDPLVHALLTDPRTARIRVRDGLWVRLVDVPTALGARRYAAPVDVVLEVVDDVCPWNAGTWRLSGDRDGATCTATGDSPDLRLDARDLGAAYLGGTPLRSRPVEPVTAGALDVASTAFGPVGAAPWCPLVF